MSVDILHMNYFQDNKSAIDIALPVIAIECEVTPPKTDFIDAYADAVLKFVDIGLTSRSIAKTINATESLIEHILANLLKKDFVAKQKGKSWEVTEKGKKYLRGEENFEDADKNSQYGYMFINAIKKEVLPYFYQGNVHQIPLYQGERLPYLLTLEGDEYKTFQKIQVKTSKLKEAYRKYYKNIEIKQDFDEKKICYEEAIDIVENDEIFIDSEFPDDIDSFDETNFEEVETLESAERERNAKLSGRMFIRTVGVQENRYLHMRIIIAPSVPGGYKVESPFNMNNIDNGYFLRQVQWLIANEKVMIDDESLATYIEKEIKKLSPSYYNKEKDFNVFVLETIPLLKSQRHKHGNMYEDMARIYSLMQNPKSLLEKESIVAHISGKILERLFNGFFRNIDIRQRRFILEQAVNDLKSVGKDEYLQRLLKKTNLNSEEIKWSFEYLNSVIGRLVTTKGNSTLEKFVNIVVVNYYLHTVETDKLLMRDNIQEIYQYLDELNQIRRKVSHDTNDRFEAKDYEKFMSKVFTLIHWLLEVYREE